MISLKWKYFSKDEKVLGWGGGGGEESGGGGGEGEEQVYREQNGSTYNIYPCLITHPMTDRHLGAVFV